MVDIERQKQLDKRKWLRSKQYGEDLSGRMIYCHYCVKQTCTHRCVATQKEREGYLLCAKAYNKMEDDIKL
jgi:hypothetical protein